MRSPVSESEESFVLEVTVEGTSRAPHQLHDGSLIEFARRSPSNFSFETCAGLSGWQLKTSGKANAREANLRKSRRVLIARSICFVLEGNSVIIVLVVHRFLTY